MQLSNAEHQASSCQGKTRYPTWSTAARAGRHINRRYATLGKPRPYRCRHRGTNDHQRELAIKRNRERRREET